MVLPSARLRRRRNAFSTDRHLRRRQVYEHIDFRAPEKAQAMVPGMKSFACAAILAAALAMCGCEPLTEVEVCPLAATITPSSAELWVGDTTRFEAFLSCDPAESNHPVMWRVSDTTVVAIDARENEIVAARARRSGTAIVTAISLRDSTARVAAAITVRSITREEGAAFQTDSLSYTLTRERDLTVVGVRVRFTNPRNERVYFVNCNGATSHHLEKLVQGEWVIAWVPALPACLSPVITVDAGASYDWDTWIYSGTGNLHPQFRVSYVPGIYRLVWGSLLRTYSANAYPFGEPLPFEQRVSNTFELRLAQ
jgi:hypothetical protein